MGNGNGKLGKWGARHQGGEMGEGYEELAGGANKNSDLFGETDRCSNGERND